MKNFYGFLTRKGKNIFLITLLSSALLFASCINDLFNDDKSSKKQETQTEQTEQTDSEELIPVKINISNKKQIENILQNVKPQKNISQARAASPQNVALKYKILYKKVTDTSQSSCELTDSSAVLKLSKGTWDFTLVAYYTDADTEKVVFTGDLLKQEITPGNNPLEFTLKEPDSGKGNISITLKLPALTDYVTSVKAQLKTSSLVAIDDYEEPESTINYGNPFVYSLNNVPHGNYFAVFSITTKNLTAASDENSTETTVYPVPVRVVTNLTSESIEKLTDIRNVCVITYALGTDGTVSWKDGATPERVYTKHQNVTLPTYEKLAPIETKIFNGWKVQGSTDSESKTTMIIEQNVTLEPDWITTTLYVDGSSGETESNALTESTAVGTLKDAVTKLVTYEERDGESYQHDWTINVNGTCYGNTWLIDTNKIDDLKITKLTIAGDNNAEDILDARTSAEGTASDAVITYDSGTFPLILENLTIQKGSRNNGGGLLLSNSTAYLNKVVLTDNTATGNGGAIALTKSNLFIYGGTVIGATTSTVAASDACSNKADGLGGGIWADKDSTIYFGYTGIDSATETMTAETGTPANSITYNYAGASEANNGGGGIYCLGKLYTWGGTISYNSAAYGGGINTAYLSMKGTTVSYNTATATNADGGGIFINNEATIASYITSADFNGTKTLTKISNNYSQMTGGGIAFYKGELYISDTKIYGNTAVSYGGGIYVPAENTAKLFVYGTTTIGADSATECAKGDDDKHSNSAALGGGIYILSSSSASASAYINYSSADDTEHTGTVNITYNYASSISENDGGGGIFAARYSSLYIAGDTTINYNAAVQQGGGILCKSAPVTITGATISYNQAKNGGGIFNCGTLTLSSATIESNTATSSGGGIYNAGYTYTEHPVLTNTEISKNTAATGGGVFLDNLNIYIKGDTIFKENTATEQGGATNGNKYTIIIQDQEETKYAYIKPNPDCNDVFLQTTDSTISIDSALSPTNHYFARITPPIKSGGTTYNDEPVYLTGNENIVSTEYNKFLVTPQSVNNTQVLWETTSEGKIKESNTTFVKIPAPTTAITGPVGDSGVFIANRTLNLKSYYICDHEVTQGEYEKYCTYGWSPGTTTEAWDTWTQNNDGAKVKKGDNYPACFVSWYDALVYCNLRSIAEGLEPVYYLGDTDKTDPASWGNLQSKTIDGKTRYFSPEDTDSWSNIKQDRTKSGWRLPLEAEWEYAARAAYNTDGNLYMQTFHYSGTETKNDAGWFTTNSTNCLQAVKGKFSNSLGLFDMSGNVVEVCWDWYADNLEGIDVEGPNTGERVAAPGGAYQYDRDLNTRSSNSRNDRFCNAGFRIVRTIKE